MNAVGYCRVSVAPENGNGHSIDAQKDRIGREAEQRGWTIEWFTDEASGKTLNRAGLQQALARLEDPDGPKTLVVAKLDRVSRSLIDSATLIARFKQRGWNLVALDLGVDLSTSEGQLLANVMAAVAQWERERIAERTREALAEAKRKGKRLGRPVTTPEPVRRRIAAERASGRSMQQIADLLTHEQVPTARGGQRWHSSTVKAVLESVRRDEEAREAIAQP